MPIGLLLLLLLLLLTWLQAQLWFGHTSIPATHRLNQTIAKLTAHNQQATARNERLIKQVYALKHTDTAVIERAREELGLIKPGETYYQVTAQAA